MTSKASSVTSAARETARFRCLRDIASAVDDVSYKLAHETSSNQKQTEMEANANLPSVSLRPRAAILSTSIARAVRASRASQ